MIESSEYEELKEQLKQEILQELIKEIPKSLNALYKEIEVTGLDKDKMYIIKVYFNDDTSPISVYNNCRDVKEMLSNLGVKCCIVPLHKNGSVCDIKIEGDPDV